MLFLLLQMNVFLRRLRVPANLSCQGLVGARMYLVGSRIEIHAEVARVVSFKNDLVAFPIVGSEGHIRYRFLIRIEDAAGDEVGPGGDGETEKQGQREGQPGRKDSPAAWKNFTRGENCRDCANHGIPQLDQNVPRVGTASQAPRIVYGFGSRKLFKRFAGKNHYTTKLGRFLSGSGFLRESFHLRHREN